MNKKTTKQNLQNPALQTGPVVPNRPAQQESPLVHPETPSARQSTFSITQAIGNHVTGNALHLEIIRNGPGHFR